MRLFSKNFSSFGVRAVAAICLMLMVLLPTVALAQTGPCSNIGTDTEPAAGLGVCVNNIYLWALGLAGILGLIMAVAGGYLVITAGGNAQQASKGRSFLYSAIIGILILMGAYLILRTINPDLVEFKFNLECLGASAQASVNCTPSSTTPPTGP